MRLETLTIETTTIQAIGVANMATKNRGLKKTGRSDFANTKPTQRATMKYGKAIKHIRPRSCDELPNPPTLLTSATSKIARIGAIDPNSETTLLAILGRMYAARARTIGAEYSKAIINGMTRLGFKVIASGTL